MTDLARLQIAVESGSVRSADRDLNILAATGEKAERAMVKLAAAAGGFYAVTRAIREAVDVAVSFEYAMGTVATVIDDRGKIPALTKQIRELSAEMGQMPTASARAMYDIISAGASDSAKAMDILTTANKLAVGGATEVGVAADGLTSIMAVYASQVKDATEVADKMFVSAAIGKTTIEALSSQLGQVAPTARAAGVSLDELLGVVGVLTKGGMNTSMSVTGIRSFLNQVTRPTEDAAKMAKRLGLDFDAAALKAKGLLGFVQDLKAKTGGEISILGKLINDTEGRNAALALTGPLSKDLQSAMDAMGQSAGKANEAFAVMADTAQFKLDQLRSKVANAAIDVGNSLLAMVPLDGLVKNFDTLVASVTGLGKALAILVAARGAAWAAEWASALKMKINVMIAARAHTIAWAQSDVAAAAAALQNAKAQLAKSGTMMVARNYAFAMAAAQRVVAAQELAVANATNVHTQALVRLKEAQSLAAVGAGGLRSIVAALGGPVGAIVALLGVLVWLGPKAWEAMKTGADKAYESMSEWLGQLEKEVAILRERKKLMEAKPETGTRQSWWYLNDDQMKVLGGLPKDELEKLVQARDAINVANAEVNHAASMLAKFKGRGEGYNSWEIAYEKAKRDRDLLMLQTWKVIDLKREQDAGGSTDATAAAEEDAKKKAAEAAKKKAAEAAEEAAKAFQRQSDAIREMRLEYAALGKTGMELYEIEAKRKGITIPALKEEAKHLMALVEAKKFHLNIEKEITRASKEADAAFAKAFKTPRTANDDIAKGMFASFQTAMDALDPQRHDRDRIASQRAAMDAWKDVMPLENYTLALKRMEREERKLQAENGDLWAAMALQVEDFSTRATDALVDFCFTGKNSFSDMVDSMLRDLARLAVQKNVTGPLFGWLGDVVGKGGTPDAGGMTTPTIWGDSASGGIAPVQKMASQGGGGLSISFPINVSGGSGNVSEGDSQRLTTDIRREVEPIVLSVIAKHQKPGGALNPTRSL